MTLDVGHLEGRTILVTGGAGFFGRAFVESVLDQTTDAKLVVYNRDEARQASLAGRLRRHADRLRFRLGDVRDLERLRLAFWKVHVVVHAAALKRVDDTARHTFEMIKTNILGTQAVLAAALEAGVERTLILSSDKACHPANPYGASKFLAERLAVEWNALSFARGQKVSCVRWGNVMGSTGSVLHTFRRALRAGEPLPITDPEMTRFWMSVEEAAAFACRALRLMRGGEVFLPKLRSAPVQRLAEALGSYGCHETVGHRPGGEKRHETLLTVEECAHAVDIGEALVIEPAWRLPVEREPWKGEPVDAPWTSASITLSHQDLAQMAAQVPDE